MSPITPSNCSATRTMKMRRLSFSCLNMRRGMARTKQPTGRDLNPDARVSHDSGGATNRYLGERTHAGFGGSPKRASEQRDAGRSDRTIVRSRSRSIKFRLKRAGKESYVSCLCSDERDDTSPVCLVL